MALRRFTIDISPNEIHIKNIIKKMQFFMKTINLFLFF